MFTLSLDNGSSEIGKTQGESKWVGTQIFERMKGRSMEHAKIYLGEKKGTEDTYREQVKEKAKQRRKS